MHLQIDIKIAELRLNYEHLKLMSNLLNTYRKYILLFNHAFVILLSVGKSFWSRSNRSIG